MKRLGVNLFVLGLTVAVLGIVLELGTRVLIPAEKEIDKNWVKQLLGGVG